MMAKCGNCGNGNCPPGVTQEIMNMGNRVTTSRIFCNCTEGKKLTNQIKLSDLVTGQTSNYLTIEEVWEIQDEKNYKK